MKTIRHILRLCHVGLTLARHDALYALAVFEDKQNRIDQLRRFGKMDLFGRHANTDDSTAGDRLVEALQSLGPTFIKFGQALAPRPDLIGTETALALTRLQDKVPPFPTITAKAVIEEELGKPVDHLFAEFDETPIAAASIAQVHFAVTPEGQKVAVKILRPGIEDAFARDLECFHWLARKVERFFAKFRRLRPADVMETIAETIAVEMDLRYEAAAASRLYDEMRDCDFFHVPKIDWERTSRRVLSIARVEGTPFTNPGAIDARGFDRSVLAKNVMQSFLTQALEHGFFHADLHQGNLFATEGNSITAIDFGIMGYMDVESRRVLAEILYGFLQRDYDHVAKVHFDAGYVPAGQSLEKFSLALRAVSEPIADKPVSEISIGRLLAQLFETTETFEMKTQPQLLLLQKTMVTVEGVAMNLDPQINSWEAARPVIEKWMRANLGPKSRLERTATELIEMGTRLPHIARDFDNLMQDIKENGITLSPQTVQLMTTQRPQRGTFQSLVIGLIGGALGALAAWLWVTS